MKISIYKVVNTVNDEIYIGSTKNELRYRLANHRSKAKKFPTRKGLYEMMNQHDAKCFRIILIRDVEVKDRTEQLQLEQKCIDELRPLLNKNNPFGNRCEHGRPRHQCKDCGGSNICDHGRQRYSCKECGGSGICDHGRQKNMCKECDGASICDHGRIRSQCKDCNGASICDHGLQRRHCKICSPMTCELCNITVSKAYWTQHLKTKKHQRNSPLE
jgi:predicted GIY-YIG superfamily endonuclease